MPSEQQIDVVREEVCEELAHAIAHGFKSHGFKSHGSAPTIFLT
jgi:hypothetical protein